jgi:hypothetical protein
MTDTLRWHSSRLATVHRYDCGAPRPAQPARPADCPDCGGISIAPPIAICAQDLDPWPCTTVQRRPDEAILAWAADDWNFMATAEILLNFRLREKMLPAYLTWSPYTLSARHGWAARSDLPHPPAGSQTDGGQMTEGRCVQELRQRIEPLPGLGPMVGQQELPSSVIGRSCPGGRLGGAADRARPSAVQQLRAEPARARDLWGGGRGRPVPPATKGPFQPGRALGGGRPVAVACISERRGTSSSRGPVGTSRPPGAV